MYKTRDAYSADDVAPIEVFFDLRKDIESLALAQYFAQLAFEMGAEGQPCEELLRLTLNSLHLLCTGKRKHAQIKAVFELRSACLGGYMPNILACENCGTYETDLMYFDTLEGNIYCENCPRAGAYPVPVNVIKAVRFICLTPPEKYSVFHSVMKILKFWVIYLKIYTVARAEKAKRA